MAFQHTTVGPATVDIAGALGLDGSPLTLENLGLVPLRFVLAEAAGEAAPADRGAGNLLEPGAREDVEPHGAFPLWAWSSRPTRIGVSPRLGG